MENIKKKLLNLNFLWHIAVITLAFACEPLSEVYDELDKGKTAGVASDFSVTLAGDDYKRALEFAANRADSTSMSTHKNFTDAQARKFIPYILNSMFPALGVGSSSVVTYSLYQGLSPVASEYAKATVYEVTKEDYQAVNESVGKAGFFSPSFQPSATIPNLLKAKVADAKDAALGAVSFMYSHADPKFEGETLVSEKPMAYIVYYRFTSGKWAIEPKGYSLTASDYDAMGEGPGKFDNFSGTVAANDYIPTFLRLKVPYAFAKEKEQLVVTYKYYSSTSKSVSTRADLYEFLNGKWNPYLPVVETALAFGKEATGWVPDNTIKFVLSSENIDFIAEKKGVSTGPGGNLKQFKTFDVRSSSANFWSEEDLLMVFSELLKNLYPNSKVGQKYQITFKIYDGAAKDQTKGFILTAEGYKLQ